MTDPIVSSLAQYGGPFVVLVYLVLQSRFGRLKRIDRKLCALVTVTRALARRTPGVDEERVDQVLRNEGLQPDDFLEDMAVAQNGRGSRGVRDGESRPPR